MLQKFKEAPRHHQSVAIAGLLVVAVSIWAVEAKGLFEGVTFFIASAAFLVGLVAVLPARPKLSVTARQSDRPHVVAQQVVRPVDQSGIAHEQTSAALSEMPRQPTPRGVRLAGSGAALGLQAHVPNWSNLTGAPSDEDLREFQEEVHAYEGRLRNWLTNLEVARTDRLRLFEGELRLHELGHAAADHALLHLFFPDGFELEDEAPDIGAPPEPPTLTTNWTDLFNTKMEMPRLEGGLLDHLRRDDDEPQYSLKDGLPEITFELGRVNQSDSRPVPTFCLKAPRQPGSYPVRWQVTATNLSKPVEGTLTVEVREPVEDAPIVSLGEAEQEREDFELF